MDVLILILLIVHLVAIILVPMNVRQARLDVLILILIRLAETMILILV